MSVLKLKRQVKNLSEENFMAVVIEQSPEQLMELGRGYVLKEPAKAFEYYLKAAEQGYAKAMVKVGDCYRVGAAAGVMKDLSKAIEWLSKAAEKNDPDGLEILGYCYDGGNGVEKNRNKAIELLRKAVALGNQSAKSALEDILSEG
jgi:hypothetical protein